MTLFEKFKQYIKENPKGRDNTAVIAEAIGTTKGSLDTRIYEWEKQGKLIIPRENAKKYKFKG